VLFTHTTAEFSRQLGQQLRTARETAGLSVDAVAARLKMHIGIIRALEAGDWERLGAPIFVRGQLRSYGRLLGVDLTGLDDIVREQAQEQVDQALQVPLLPQERRNRLYQALLVVAMLVAAAVLWWGVQWRESPSRDAAQPRRDAVQAERPESTATGDGQPGASVSLPGAETMTDAGNPPGLSGPVNAEPETDPPLPRPPVRPASAITGSTGADNSVLTLRLIADSWVELYATNGRVIEQNLLHAGDIRHFRRGQLGRVVIGNAGGVEVLRGGVVQDLSPYQRANVVRFAVSSEGVIRRVSN